MPARVMELGAAAHAVRRNVRHLRAECGMTQLALAQAVTATGHSMPLEAVHRLERGGRRVDVDDLVAFARVFGVEVERLLSAPAVLVPEVAVPT